MNQLLKVIHVAEIFKMSYLFILDGKSFTFTKLLDGNTLFEGALSL